MTAGLYVLIVTVSPRMRRAMSLLERRGGVWGVTSPERRCEKRHRAHTWVQVCLLYFYSQISRSGRRCWTWPLLGLGGKNPSIAHRSRFCPSAASRSPASRLHGNKHPRNPTGKKMKEKETRGLSHHFTFKNVHILKILYDLIHINHTTQLSLDRTKMYWSVVSY